MKHIFQKGKTHQNQLYLLLHGTGGNELDLLPLAGMIDDEASVLSVRGNVLENGMPRFFRRLAEGVFDEEDLIFRTKELNQFLMKQQKNMNLTEIILLRLATQMELILRLVCYFIIKMH